MVHAAGIPDQQALTHPVDEADLPRAVDGADGPAGRTVAVEQSQAERAGQMSEHRHHDPHDRSGARALFIELGKLPEGSPEKAELRNRLVRMHLPLVEHLARRFRNRGEPLDDLTQVATIGLIKSVDRFDPERGSSSRRTPRPRSSVRSSAISATRAGRCGCRAVSRSCGCH